MPAPGRRAAREPPAADRGVPSRLVPRADAGLTRVNYRDMGPEELGSVYESLLELVPDLQGLASPPAPAWPSSATTTPTPPPRATPASSPAATTRPTAWCRSSSRARWSLSSPQTVQGQPAAAGRGAAVSSPSATRPAAAATSCWPPRAAWPTKWRCPRRCRARRRRPHARRLPPCAARRGQPLHLRRRQEPDGHRSWPRRRCGWRPTRPTGR